MIFLTGGAGYIGSHTCVELMARGYDVTIFDNFSNSSERVMDRIAAICGKRPQLIRGDICDRPALERALEESCAHTVIHFAGLKSVGESVQHPLAYYQNNFVGTVCLLEAMQTCGVNRLVFSSSATVYGVPHYLPLDEKHPLGATNPYGRTKQMIEGLLQDVVASRPSLRVGILRYFNPVGAHPSGLIGEDPMGIPNNLMPFVAQVAVGQRPCLNVWGDDYDTPDGTGVRDYIHVVDLALGHVKCLEYLDAHTQCTMFNLGTGVGYSVKEVVQAFEQASGKSIACSIGPRRSGDVASCYADASFAKQQLGWSAQRSLKQMCEDAWHWQSMNPRGYKD